MELISSGPASFFKATLQVGLLSPGGVHRQDVGGGLGPVALTSELGPASTHRVS